VKGIIISVDYAMKQTKLATTGLGSMVSLTTRSSNVYEIKVVKLNG
jgi:hypothetical protein